MENDPGRKWMTRLRIAVGLALLFTTDRLSCMQSAQDYVQLTAYNFRGSDLWLLAKLGRHRNAREGILPCLQKRTNVILGPLMFPAKVASRFQSRIFGEGP